MVNTFIPPTREKMECKEKVNRITWKLYNFIRQMASDTCYHFAYQDLTGLYDFIDRHFLPSIHTEFYLDLLIDSYFGIHHPAPTEGEIFRNWKS